MKSTSGSHQNPANTFAHVSEALTNLYKLLNDLDRQRDAVRDAIQNLNINFIPPAPTPQRPQRKKDESESGLPRMLSRYPVHPKGEKLERANDDDDDYDLSGIMVHFAGTSTWPERVRAVAKVAHLAGKAPASVRSGAGHSSTSAIWIPASKWLGHEVSRRSLSPSRRV